MVGNICKAKDLLALIGARGRVKMCGVSRNVLRNGLERRQSGYTLSNYNDINSKGINRCSQQVARE